MNAGVRLAALLAVAVLGLGACGSDDPETKENTKQVRAVVNDFAKSSDAHACDLLTREAVVELYGGGASAASVSTAQADEAKAKCVKASGSFRGASVQVKNIEIIGDRAAKVKVLNAAGDREYNVLLRKPDDEWLIDQITQKAVPRA